MEKATMISNPWLASLLPYAVSAKERWPGMRIACSLAQAAIETGYGKHPIGGYNLWGLKDLNWNPGRVLVTTHEYVPGKGIVLVEQLFEDFTDLQEAFDCYGRLVTNSPNYAATRAESTLSGYVYQLSQKWATDPHYAEKLWNIITKEGLVNLDDEVSHEDISEPVH